jgi:hypothetical protein
MHSIPARLRAQNNGKGGGAWRDCERAGRTHRLSIVRATFVPRDGRTFAYVPCTRCPVSFRQEVAS